MAKANGKLKSSRKVTVSKTFSTKAKAEQWARLVESEMDRGGFISTSEAETTQLSELLDKYEKEVAPTLKSEKNSLIFL